jgi:hypothetical protein
MTTQEQDRLMREYDRIEELEESARRRCDFKLARQYQAMLKKLEAQIWPWMAQGNQ